MLCAGLKTAGEGTADTHDEQDTVPTETNSQSTPFVTLSVALHSLNNVHTSSRGGEHTSLLGPGEPYTPNSEKDTSCLGPVEPYAPSTHIVLAHIGKKVRAQGTANHPRRPGLSFRYVCGYGYTYNA